MRKYLLAAAAVAAIASPAMARDGAGYVGIEGGVLFPRDSSYDVTVSNIPTGTAATARTTTTFGNGFEYEYKRGYDIDAVAGYDFGMFRLEGELGYKRARRDDFTPSAALIAGINTGIGFTNPGVGNQINVNQFNGFRRTDVQSAMVNALVDFGTDPGVNFFAGGGIGGARVRTMGDRDRALAWQLIAGARTAITPNVDLGLKYRYFQTRRLNFTNTQTFGLGAPTNVYGFNSEGKFRSHSLLASLIFNFGGVEAAPPPPVVEAAPPPPPPPATQTCPDGSVIDATASCPVPPPPPPPPAQGERG